MDSSIQTIFLLCICIFRRPNEFTSFSIISQRRWLSEQRKMSWVRCVVAWAHLIEHNLRLGNVLLLGVGKSFSVRRLLPIPKLLEFRSTKLIKIPYLFASWFFSIPFFPFIRCRCCVFSPFTFPTKDKESIINRLGWIIASTLRLLFYGAAYTKLFEFNWYFNVVRPFREFRSSRAGNRRNAQLDFFLSL